MIKQVWRYFTFAIGWGSFLMVMNLVFMDLTSSDGLQNFLDNPTANVIGFIVLGIGFFGTAIVYEIERLSFRLKLVIHLIVGVGLFLLVGFNLGWVFTENPITLILNITIYIGIIFAAWVVFYIRDKNEVQKINKVLEEQNHKKTIDSE